MYISQMIHEAIYHFSDQCRSGCNMYQIAPFLIDPGIGKKKRMFFLSYSDIKILQALGTQNYCAPLLTHPEGSFNPTQAEE